MPRTGFFTACRRAIALAAVAMLAIGAVGCGGAEQATAPVDPYEPTGKWTLQEIEAGALPVTIYDDAWFDEPTGHFYKRLVVQITGGDLALNADGRFTLAFEVSVNRDGQREVSRQRIDGAWWSRVGIVALGPDDDRRENSIGYLGNGWLMLSIDYMGNGEGKMYAFRKR
jgi:hypothetical protein